MLFAFVDLFFTEVLGFLSAAQNRVSLPSLLDADFQLAFFPLCWRIKIVLRLAWGRKESLSPFFSPGQNRFLGKRSWSEPGALCLLMSFP